MDPRSRTSLLALAAVASAACAATATQQLWRDPAYGSAPVRRVFVLAVSSDRQDQVRFENGFAEALQRKGFEVGTASSIWPPGPVDRSKVAAHAKQENFDLLLVVTPVLAGPVAAYSAPPVANAETNVYAAKVGSEVPVWTGTSRVTNYNTVQEAADGVAASVLADLDKARVLVR